MSTTSVTSVSGAPGPPATVAEAINHHVQEYAGTTLRSHLGLRV
ncbi:hypothetical protein [Kribbella sp. NPDC049584]